MGTPVGEQLELFSDRVMREHTVRVPWEGLSPRALTRGFKWPILKTQGGKSCLTPRDTGQYDLWLPEEKAPRIYRGAPFLLPLEGRDNRG